MPLLKLLNELIMSDSPFLLLSCCISLYISSIGISCIFGLLLNLVGAYQVQNWWLAALATWLFLRAIVILELRYVVLNCWSSIHSGFQLSELILNLIQFLLLRNSAGGTLLELILDLDHSHLLLEQHLLLTDHHFPLHFDVIDHIFDHVRRVLNFIYHYFLREIRIRHFLHRRLLVVVFEVCEFLQN